MRAADEIAALEGEIFETLFVKRSKVMIKMSQTVFFSSVSAKLSMKGAACVSDFLLNRRNDF